ncbi:MAG: sulfotransferase [Planctomycetaceae bacterium]|nr:sulfotransferase [Planctomycetales bacterium]MCB9924647.1 sulfotransferase [Planctomycetaceae bacterium]
MSGHRNERTFAEAVETIRVRWPDALDKAPTDSPVFVLAAGWRSGSTLLQRMLMRECFIWGEPYGHSCMLQQLADPLRCITGDWPETHFFLNENSRDPLSGRFVANLYPSVTTLLDSHRAYLETMFKGVGRVETRPVEGDNTSPPGRDPAYARWGFKEVRLSADYAHYLKLLYPRCKLLFLIRNPYDAYRSWAARRNAGWKWFYRWPDQPVTARLFGRLWTELAGSFVEQAKQLDAQIVRYESLKVGEYETIESYLGFGLNCDAAKVRPADGPPPIETIPQAELDELGDELHALAESLEYSSGRMDASSVPESRLGRDPAMEEAKAGSRPSLCDPARCVVLVPIGGSVVPACEDALAELERRGYQVRRVRGYSAIDQGRNQMATDALADGFDETMWIDADVGFDPNDIERLRQHDVPIVCGIYPQKGRRVLACHVLPGTEKLIFGDEGGLTEILYAGTGFLLVRRNAYETIQRELQLPLCNERFGGRPMVPFFQPMSHPELVEGAVCGHWYLAEDFAFCQRARQAGFKIYADTRVRLMHYGNYGYSWEDAGIELQRYRTFHFHTK